jgi:hypothetical protein
VRCRALHQFNDPAVLWAVMRRMHSNDAFSPHGLKGSVFYLAAVWGCLENLPQAVNSARNADHSAATIAPKSTEAIAKAVSISPSQPSLFSYCAFLGHQLPYGAAKQKRPGEPGRFL